MQRLRPFALASLLLGGLAVALAAAPMSPAEIRGEVARYADLQEWREELGEEFQESASLVAYRREYYAALGSPRSRRVAPVRVHRALAGAATVLMSDFHLTARSQERGAEVLEAMSRGAGSVILVLEWIDRSFQAEVDAYLAGDLDLATLRERVRYDEVWPFPWEPYAGVLATAKRVGAKVKVVDELLADRQPSLRERDDLVVAAVEDLRARDPQVRVLVIYGAFHVLGRGHLGEKLAGAGHPASMTLVGEAPGIYHEALHRARDHDLLDYLSLGGGRYYVQNGTPLERLRDEVRSLEGFLGYADDD